MDLDDADTRAADSAARTGCSLNGEDSCLLPFDALFVKLQAGAQRWKSFRALPWSQRSFWMLPDDCK